MPGLFTFALTLQQLPTRNDQVLVVMELLSSHQGAAWLRPASVLAIFEEFHLPPPGNIHQVLSGLAHKELIRKGPGNSTWGLTPLGRDRVQRIGLDVDSLAVERAANQLLGGASLGHARHAVVPPFLAPPRWLQGIGRFLASFPFERNVFAITRYPRSADADPISDAIAASREALGEHGLVLHLASERQIVDDLTGNVMAHIWSCMFGLAFFETRIQPDVNHNVAIEVGSMLMTGRRCAVLKDSMIQAPLPTDFAGQIYKTTDLGNVTEVASVVHGWVSRDLGERACAKCPD